jgi:hypothetical protein
VLVDFNQLDAGLLHNEWVADDNIPDLFDRMGVFLAKQD